MARVRRGWMTRERILWQQQVQAHLPSRGLPVPRPAAPPITWRGSVVELEPFVPDDVTIVTPERFARACEVLGRIHAALDGRAPRFPRQSTYCPPPRLERWIARTHAVVLGPEARALCGRAADLVRAKLAPWWRRAAPRLRRGLIHGDFHGRNVLYRGDAIAAVLDFDFCGTRPRAFDLAYALVFGLLRMAGMVRMDLRRVWELAAAYDSPRRHRSRPRSAWRCPAWSLWRP